MKQEIIGSIPGGSICQIQDSTPPLTNPIRFQIPSLSDRATIFVKHFLETKHKTCLAASFIPRSKQNMHFSCLNEVCMIVIILNFKNVMKQKLLKPISC